VAKAPSEKPEGLVYRPDGLTVDEERSASRLRFQRGKGDQRRVWQLVLEPRSGYVLARKARTSWQHSIPPTKELRCSITFRTLRAKVTP
jgi:hypothetical protein